jgi:hypothetical protein
MDCYKVLSPSAESLFAIRSLRFFVSASRMTLIRHLFSNWRRRMPVKSFAGFLSVSYQNVLTPR